jgi:hypothetical protein
LRIRFASVHCQKEMVSRAQPFAKCRTYASIESLTKPNHCSSFLLPQQTHNAIQSLTDFLVSEQSSTSADPSINTIFSPWIAHFTKAPVFTVSAAVLLHNWAIKPPPLFIILNDSFIQNRIASDLITKNTKWVFDLWNFFIESCQLSLYSDMVFFLLEFVSSVSKGEGENRWARRSTCTRLEFFAFLERYPVSLFAGFLRSRCFLLSPSYTSPFSFFILNFVA